MFVSRCASVVFVCVVVRLALSALSAQGLESEREKRPMASGGESSLVGKPAPRFRLAVANPSRAGMSALSLKRHVGSKPKDPRRAVVLSFFASWCKSCREELPELVKLLGPWSKKGVLGAIVITDEEREGRESARDLVLDSLDPPLPVVFDISMIVARRYGAERLPFLVLIGADGTVRWEQVGGGTPVRNLEEALERLSREAR